MSREGDARELFWQHVDSSSVRPSWLSMPEWGTQRNAECIALMASRERCTRPAINGWCDFHFDRLIKFVADHEEGRILRWVERMNRGAFRWYIEASQIADAHRVLERADSQVYFIACGDFVKIGYSKNPEARLTQLKQGRNAKSRTLAPDGLDLAEAVIVGCIPGEQETERELHRRLATYRAVGEWFRLSPTVITTIDCVVFGEAPPRAIEAGLIDMAEHGGRGRRRWDGAA